MVCRPVSCPEFLFTVPCCSFPWPLLSLPPALHGRVPPAKRRFPVSQPRVQRCRGCPVRLPGGALFPTASQMGSEASLKTVLGDASLKATHPSLDSSHCWTFLSLAETCHDLCPLVAAGFLGAQHSRAYHLGRALSLLQACARCAKNTKTWAHPPGDHGTVRRLNRNLQSNVRSPPIDRVTRWPMRVRA